MLGQGFDSLQVHFVNLVGVYNLLGTNMHILERIRRFFQTLGADKHGIQKTLLKKEHALIMNDIVQTKTLAQLFNIRTRLIQYNEEVKRIGSPRWAINSVKFLEAKWDRQYKLWKLRG